MTKQEALDLIVGASAVFTNRDAKQMEEAIYIAIKALEDQIREERK